MIAPRLASPRRATSAGPCLLPQILAVGWVGVVVSGLLGNVALGQSTPAGFSHIPGGSFTMGATSGDTDAAAPPITVTLSPFYMQQTETTKAQWDEVRTWAVSNGYTDLAAGEGKAANHPVHSVSWWDVIKWCNARSEKEGLTPVYTVSGAVMRTGTTQPVANWSANGYRLPTEAEWEKAARGGVSGKRFPWGTDTISHAEANFRNNGAEAYATGTTGYHPNYTEGGTPYTSPVGSFVANGFGLYDMSGNVLEWCWDRYGSTYYSTSNGTTDPRGPDSGSGRVGRGGTWSGSAFLTRCSERFNLFTPGLTVGNDFGFRTARSHIVNGMALIPGGSFTMGRTSGDTDADAPPVTVTVSGFYLQETETTTAQWDEVRTWGLSNGYIDLPVGGGKAANHPVHSVSWWDAVKWCNARSEREGLTPVYMNGANVMRTGTTAPDANWSANGYRLPTEAEWEKAARGGVSGKRFPWGTDTISHAEANFSNDGGENYQSGTTGYHPTYDTGGFPYTSPLGSFAANGFGLYDMSGNLFEWCWDLYQSNYYTNGAVDPREPAGTWRVVRGGSWVTGPTLARCSSRYDAAATDRYSGIGFRTARSSAVATSLPPEVTTPTATSFTATSATLGGNVTSDGGATITERGVVYSPAATNADPLIDGTGVTKVTTTGNTGVFTLPVTGLTQGTGYTFKAYAINSEGTAYSSVASFLTLSNDANLGGLVLDGFGFSPAFANTTATYAATVQRSDGTVRIRPTSAHSGASLFARVNGGGWVPVSSGSLSLPLPLEFGDNLVEVRVIAQDGATEQLYSLEVFRNQPRPDAMVGRSVAFMGGANVYSSSSAQQLPLVATRARAVSGYVAVANRGNRPDRFNYRGNGDNRYFKVEYRNATGALVSASVKAGLYRTAEMEPGAPIEWLRVTITPVKNLIVVKMRKKTVTLRKAHTAHINATSVLDPAVGDGVSIRVETR